MIAGFLNAILSADTSAFDGGLAKASKGVASFKEAVDKQSTAVTSAFSAMGKLSGLGDSFNGAVAKVTTFGSQIYAVVGGITSSFRELAKEIITPFVSIASAITSITTEIVGFIAKPLMLAASFAAVDMALHGVRFTATAMWEGLAIGARFAGSIVTAIGQEIATVFSAVSKVVTGGLANAFTFFTGLVANIPLGGIGIAIGGIAIGVTSLAAATSAAAAGATLLAVPTAAWAAFGSTVTLVISSMTPLLPLIGSLGAAIGALASAPFVLGAVVGGFAAAGAAAVGFALKLHSMASAAVSGIEEIRKLAMQLGITTQAMSALALLGGIEPHGFARGMLHMQRSVEDGAEHIAVALSKINLNPNQLKGLDATAQLRVIAAGFSALTAQGDRASVAMGLFGRHGLELIEPLSRGAAGIDALTVKAERFGLSFSTAQAAAIRSANREWKGFSYAMEGIGRQAAVLFAPLWESIGKVGGLVGEYLVNQFKNFAAVAKAAMPDIEAVALQLWSTIKEGVTQASTWIRTLGADWGMTWNSMADVGLTALAGVIVAAGDLKNTWEIVTVGMNVVWIKFMQEIKEPASTTIGFVIGVWRSFGAVWELTKNTMKVAWIEFVRDISNTFTINVGVMIGAVAKLALALSSPFSAAALASELRTSAIAAGTQMGIELANAQAAVTAGATDISATIRDAQSEIRTGWFSGLDDSLASAVAQFERATRRMGGNVSAMVARWRREMGQVLTEASTAASQPILSGLSKAVTGHEAVTAQSEKAFSLLYGGQGTESYYAKQTAEATKTTNGYLDKISRDLATAPIMRRASR